MWGIILHLNIINMKKENHFLLLSDVVNYCLDIDGVKTLVLSSVDAETIELCFKVHGYSNFFSVYQLCSNFSNLSLKMTTDGDDFMIFLHVEDEKLPF